MLLFVGLGNPGEKHKNNRHNVGFMALDCLSSFHKFGRSRTKFLGRTSMGSIEDRKLISFKPQTFMNESGRAVREASNFYKISPERIIVFHDELDLPFGEVRVKKGGSDAGHNGLKSMTYAKSAPLQEFTNMDERMTNKLLSVQQQAVNLGKDK